jgi:putative membrane protein
MRGRTPLGHVARGLLMGGADVIPGVSGGTMALIVGIYERLITSLRALAGGRVREAEWGFLIPLGVGIASAVGLGSVVIPPLLDAYPAQTSALFLGLVAASIPVPWRRITAVGPAHLAAVGGAAVVAFILVGLPPAEVQEPGGLQVFGSAAIAICAMILPGVSGAFLLEALGVYQVTLEALRNLDLAYIATFVLGAVLGLGAFAKLLGALLERAHDMTMAVLVGLMVGALRALWPWLDGSRALLAPPADVGHVVGVAALTVAGFAAVTLIVGLGARRLDAEPLPTDPPTGRP